MNDIIKIIQALENSNILLKGVTKTIKNETNQDLMLFFQEIIYLKNKGWGLYNKS